MSNTKRIFKIIGSLLTIVLAVVMFLHPDAGYPIAILILDVSLLLYGIRLLIYYFTMARFMVNGLMTFYKSIIVLDFGLFVFNMANMPKKVTMLYLIVCLALLGAKDIIDAVGAKKLDAPSWKFQFSYGAVKIILAVVCLFYLDSVRIATSVYCLGMVHSAVSDIISACRRTSVVYIE